jgi:hypothetical protein
VGVGLVPALGLLVRSLPSSGSSSIDALIGFAVCLAPVSWVSWEVVRARLKGSLLWALFLGGTAVGFLLSFAGWGGVAASFKVVAAVAAGCLLGRQMVEGWWLALVALVALAADAWSVFAGPTRLIVERAPGVLDYLLVNFSALGGTSGGFGLGMSDLFFLGLFLTGCVCTGLRSRATMYAAALGLLATVLLALLLNRALPALPLLSLAFLAANADLLWAGAREAWRGRR